MTGLSHRWPLGLSRRNWPLYVLGLLIALAALLGFDAGLSQTAINWPNSIRGFFRLITDYGLSDWILIPSLVLFCIAALTARLLRSRWDRLLAAEVASTSAFIFIGVGLPGLVSNIMKRIIGRGRPELFDSVGPYSFQNIFNHYTYQSFPSGHTTTSFAFAMVIGFLWPRLFPLVLIAALAVGFSRIPIGMHYPSDVLGGVVVGTLGAYAVRNAFAERRVLFARLPDGRVRRRRGQMGRWLSRSRRRLLSA